MIITSGFVSWWGVKLHILTHTIDQKNRRRGMWWYFDHLVMGVTWNTIKNNLSSTLKACNWPLIQKTLLILQCTNMARRQYDISINKHAHLLTIQVWSLDPTNIHLLTTQMKSQHFNSPFLSTLHFLPKILARMGKVESTYARSLFLLSIASLQKCTYQVP